MLAPPMGNPGSDPGVVHHPFANPPGKGERVRHRINYGANYRGCSKMVQQQFSTMALILLTNFVRGRNLPIWGSVMLSFKLFY